MAEEPREMTKVRAIWELQSTDHKQLQIAIKELESKDPLQQILAVVWIALDSWAWSRNEHAR